MRKGGKQERYRHIDYQKGAQEGREMEAGGYVKTHCTGRRSLWCPRN